MGEEVEQIKERLNIADIVAEYVTLKPAGQHMKGLCPFHQEKTPSFMVSPERGTWHCFGSCSEGGDVFTFIQKIEGLDFPAALRMLAERAGVTLKSRGSTQSGSRRQRLFDVMAAATHFYHQVLMSQAAGKKAQAYVVKRGITLSTMKEFHMGYAPHQWAILQEWLSRQGFTEEEMIAVGLIGKTKQGKLYDRFRGRIIFPVADTQGRVVAFGGRIVPWHETGNEGKYINSPESALYEKRRVVYNLDRAKHALRHKQPCLVMEGYMDVVMTVQAGVQNVVATSGTAFTSDHIEQLRRYTSTLHFAFDADAAGWKATITATQAAFAAGLAVATIVLPKGKDPADMVLEKPEEAATVFSTTTPLVPVLLEQLRAAPDTQTQEQQLEALLSLLRLVRNPIYQGHMVQEIAHTLHVPEEQLHTRLRQVAISSPALQQGDLSTASDHVSNRSAEAEHQLVGLLLLSPTVRKQLFEYLEDAFFLDGASLALYNSMQRLAQARSEFFSLSAHDLISALPEEHIPFAEGVKARAQELMETTSHTEEQEGRLLLRSLQRRSLKARLAQLQQALLSSGEAERAQTLEQFQTLARQLSSTDHL